MCYKIELEITEERAISIVSLEIRLPTSNSEEASRHHLKDRKILKISTKPKHLTIRLTFHGGQILNFVEISSFYEAKVVTSLVNEKSKQLLSFSNLTGTF